MKIHRLVVVGLGHDFHRTDCDGTGVIHNYVNAAPTLGYSTNKMRDLLLVSDVTRDCQRLNAPGDQLSLRAFECISITATDNDTGSFTGEFTRQRQAQTPR